MGVYLVVCGIGGVVFAGEDMERASSCGQAVAGETREVQRQ